MINYSSFESLWDGSFSIGEFDSDMCPYSNTVFYWNLDMFIELLLLSVVCQIYVCNKLIR